MNVIAGKYKHRKLKTLPSLSTRPTTARVKEDLFNILNNYFIFTNKVSLDLFAGSGALSLEGLSRGVKKAYVNDLNPEALVIIKENFHGLDPNDYVLSQSDYLVLLNQLTNSQVKVDLIYLDPPFPHTEYYEQFFQKLAAINLLNNWGVIVVESPIPLEEMVSDWLKLLKSKVVKSKVDKYLYVFRLEEKEN